MWPSSMTVPKAGNMLLETEAKFLISPLERLLKSKGRGDAVINDDDIVSLPELREGIEGGEGRDIGE